MIKKGLLLGCVLCLSTPLVAQTDNFRQAYDAFRQQARQTYDDFRANANKEYAEFVRKAWEEYQALPAITKPKEENIPPIVIADEDVLQPIKGKPVLIDEEIRMAPKFEPQPVPVSPIREEPTSDEKWVSFIFYGTPLKVRFGENQRFTLTKCTESKVADAWERMSDKDFNNTIRDCLEIRITRNMGDWAYLQMLDCMAQACMGKGNEATLLMAYVFCQSGYKMRLGLDSERLCLLFASKHNIYDMGAYKLDGSGEGEFFYLYGKKANRMSICKAAFPQEKPLSLWLNQSMTLEQNKSDARTLKALRYPEMEFTVSVNKNMVDFMNDYPSSMVNYDFMTRWAMYANVPLEPDVQDKLLSSMREKLQGLDVKMAVEKVLNWVQTAFVYEYDDKVWGEDRAFFSEETLYYPYCDCEDRAILFTRLVRDLFGLKCVLVYYPGHLASAICFTEEVEGDYIDVDGDRYIVCDPTYIGASIGRTMPGMDNKKASAIILK